jgi:hypothetical protein
VHAALGDSKLSGIAFVPDAARSQQRKTSRDDAAELARLCSEALRWETVELTELHARRYLLRETALEFFFASNPPVLFNFPIPEDGKGGGGGGGGGGRIIAGAAMAVGLLDRAIEGVGGVIDLSLTAELATEHAKAAAHRMLDKASTGQARVP